MSDLAWAILTLGFLASCFIGALLLALHDYGRQRRAQRCALCNGRGKIRYEGHLASWWIKCPDCSRRTPESRP